MADRRLIKYYDDDEQKGVIIDWDDVAKEFKKLKIPENVYNPLYMPFIKCRTFFLLSERKVGKTTNILLLGMLLFRMYGLRIIYVRESEDMIGPSIVGELFNTITTFNNGAYIKELTNGEYNAVYYHWKKMYFVKKDLDGKIEKQDEAPFLSFLSIDRNFDYKSGLSIPNPGIIMWDECLSPLYKMDEYINFHDLLSTVIREKLSAYVIMLSNTIDMNHTLLKEYMISKEVKKLKVGESKFFEGKDRDDERPIYIELIGINRTDKQKKNRRFFNSLYFGLNNPKMAAITGEDVVWSYEPKPHRMPLDNDIIINRDLRIDMGTNKIQIELTYTEDLGLIVYAHECSIDYKDSVFLILDDITKKNQMYGFGHGKFCKKIWELYEYNKWYFDTNETGAAVENFVKNCRQMRK